MPRKVVSKTIDEDVKGIQLKAMKNALADLPPEELRELIWYALQVDAHAPKPVKSRIGVQFREIDNLLVFHVMSTSL
jgi:hypothetical protein